MLFLFFVVSFILSQKCDPECANGGVCIATNTCYCSNPGWQGAICDEIACLNGGKLSDVGICTCPDGWMGPRCEVCKSDDVCGSGRKCDKTLAVKPSITKFVDCKVLPPLGKLLGNNMTMQWFMDSTLKNGKASLELWLNTSSSHIGELFWCDFSSCSLQSSSNGDLDFYCTASKCGCTKICSSELRSIIELAKGYGKISCDSYGKCEFKQEAIPFTGDIQCVAGTCS